MEMTKEQALQWLKEVKQNKRNTVERMKKVLADGTLGISEVDRFEAPAGVYLNLNCDGSDADASGTSDGDDSYFFD